MSASGVFPRGPGGNALVAESGEVPSSASPLERRPDRVSEASMESFPASDPPAWMAMRVGPPITAADRLQEDV